MKRIAIAVTVACAALLSQAAVDLDSAIEYETTDVSTVVPAPYSAVPVEINLFSPLQVPFHERSVTGFRWNVLYGWSADVTGLDIGLVGAGRGSAYGLQVAGYSYVEGEAYGLQVGLLGNFVQKDVYGLQIGGLLSFCDLAEIRGVQIAPLNFDAAMYGLQIGLLNWNFGLVNAFQLAAVNVVRADFTGVEIAAFNHANSMSGLQIGAFNMLDEGSVGCQIGAFNMATELKGVQIGLININQRGAVPVMPIANANF